MLFYHASNEEEKLLLILVPEQTCANHMDTCHNHYQSDYLLF